MSDQTTQPVEAEAPAAVDTPAGTDQQQGPNWEERYKEGQAWQTRMAEELAEFKKQQQDPEYQAKVAQEWLSSQGYTIPTDDDDFDDSPSYVTREEFDELKQWREQQSSEAQREAEYADYRGGVDPQLTEMGVPAAFLDSVADIAFTELPGIQTPQGLQPDLAGAFERFKEVAENFASVPMVQDHVMKTWAKTKRAPYVPAGGRPANEVPDPGTGHNARMNRAMQAVHEEQQG